MKPQGQHGLLPRPTRDEAAREACIGAMRRYFTTELIGGNRELYDNQILPDFREKHHRAPESAKEIQKLMKETFYYRASSLIGRATQELLWDTVGESVERQLDELVEKARPKPGELGTVTVDPDMPMPKYIEDVDIHVMPGNFHTELGEDDVFAGALYDRGAYVFAYGSRGQYNERLGLLIAGMLKSKFPNFKPKRILEIGCSMGSSTVSLKDGFPDAEVYGIDVSAPMVRYAHARAESLGRAIHFKQMDGAHTKFPDGYFDLVLSILVNHEQPLKVIQQQFKDSYRILAPGGIMLTDGLLKTHKPPPSEADHFRQFMGQWFSLNNNEPFGKGVDLERDFAAAGFHVEDMFDGTPEGDTYLAGHVPAHSYVGAVKR
jgi:ubiquinone/menaquinone biosynthesis C-methylase UbiE